MTFGADQNFGMPGAHPSGDDLSRQIGQRLQASELRSAQTLSSMPCQPYPNQSSLEETLKSIVSHIEVSDQRTSQAFQSIQQQMAQMASHPNMGNSPYGQQNSNALNSLEERLNNVVGQLEANMAQNSTANSRLESQVSNIAAQYAQSSGAAYDQETADLRAIDGQLQNLGMHQENLDSRLGDLADRIDQNMVGEQDPALSALQNQVQELHHHINSAPAHDAASQNTIDSHLAHISERLAETENRINSIASLEANLQELTQRVGEPSNPADIEQNKNALSALNQALGALRMQTKTSEEKTNETLEAVHDTLEKVISRISNLEQTPPEVIYRGNQSENISAQIPEEFQQPNMAPPPSSPMPEAAPQMTTSSTEMAADIAPSPQSTGRAGAVSHSFIQAARRAAQENIEGKTATSEERPKEKTKKSGGSSKRKPLLIAAAAVLLVIGGLQSYKLVKTGKINLPVISKLIQKDKTKNATPAPTTEFSKQSEPDTTTPVTTAPAKLDAAPDKPLPATDAPGASITQSTLEKTTLPEAPQKNIVSTAIPAVPDTVATSITNTADASTTSGVGAKSKSTALQKSPPVKTTQPKKVASPPPLGSGYKELPTGIGSESLRRAAASGNREAQFAIATRYLNGQGVKKDTSKALVWYQRSAAKGLAPAQYRLGTFYEKGRGVKQDKLTARIWYERAAEQGNRKAMHNLAVIYADANNGKPDFTKAALWFRKASERDLTDSQFNMGILSERGLGVPKDMVEAYKWFAVAGAKGDKDSEARKQSIAGKMDPRSLVLAKLAVDNWAPRPVKKSANFVDINKKDWLTSSAQKNQKYIKRQMIAEAQSRLNKLGYKAGPPDGILGRRTKVAIKNYQQRMGLKVTGTASADLIKHLRTKSG